MCRLRHQMDTKYLGYFFDSSETWIAVARKRFIQAFAVKARFFGNLSHTFFPGQVTKSNNKYSWVIVHKGVVKVFVDFLFGFQVIERAIRGCLGRHDFTSLNRLRCLFSFFDVLFLS